MSADRVRGRADAGVGGERGRGCHRPSDTEELAGSEAPRRGSNQDRNQGGFALRSFPGSLRTLLRKATVSKQEVMLIISKACRLKPLFPLQPMRL